jgi:hypothetical protein
MELMGLFTTFLKTVSREANKDWQNGSNGRMPT